jgi:hypothetical protein
MLAVPATARRVGDAVLLYGDVTINNIGAEFFIRDSAGFTHRVRAVWSEPTKLEVGSQVRLYGQWRNGMMYATNIRVLQKG